MEEGRREWELGRISVLFSRVCSVKVGLGELERERERERDESGEDRTLSHSFYFLFFSFLFFRYHGWTGMDSLSLLCCRSWSGTFPVFARLSIYAAKKSTNMKPRIQDPCLYGYLLLLVNTQSTTADSLFFIPPLASAPTSPLQPHVRRRAV